MANIEDPRTPEPNTSDEVQPWVNLAHQVGQLHDADVILFSGEIEHEGADALIRLVKQTERRKNVVLLLTTRGGSADAAFRIARCLQTHYTKLILYIHGRCKSAGTLVAIGVHEIVLSDFGEFGPLDVQLGKKDELFESSSGLDVTSALDSLNLRTYTFFKDVLVGIRRGTRGQISTKLAAELASKLAVGVFSHVYGQIDPVQLGAIERAMRIAVNYGEKLATDNIRKDAIERLATGYPSHGFVIDLQEARTLFKEVREPTPIEEQLGECISFVTRDETDQSFVELLNKAEASNADAKDLEHGPIADRVPRPSADSKSARSGKDHSTSRATIVPSDSPIAAAPPAEVS